MECYWCVCRPEPRRADCLIPYTGVCLEMLDKSRLFSGKELVDRPPLRLLRRRGCCYNLSLAFRVSFILTIETSCPAVFSQIGTSLGRRVPGR
jgi:hypothetical protein